MKDTILSILRHLLTFGGGFLAAKGILPTDTLNQLVPVLIAAVGGVWGAWDEYSAAKAAKATITPPAA